MVQFMGIPQKIGLGCRGISSGSPFGGLRLFYSQTSRLWASFPMYFSERKGCDRLFCRDKCPPRTSNEAYFILPSLRFRASFSFRLQNYIETLRYASIQMKKHFKKLLPTTFDGYCDPKNS